MEETFEGIVTSVMEEAAALLAIDSPTGYTAGAADHVMAAYRALGLAPEQTRKGGVLVCLNPEAPEAGGLLRREP